MAGKSGSKEKSGMKTGEDDLDFRAVTDASLNGIIVFQGEDIVYVNRAAAEIVGYTKDELLGIKFWEVIHPDFQDPVRKHGLSMQRGESAESRVEVKVAGKNGRERWVDAYSSLIEYHGRPAALISVMDITEHKQAEQAIRESEEKYHSLFEYMINGFAHCKMLYDDQGNPDDLIYLDVNKAFGKLTGLENVIGKKITEVIPGIKESHPELFEIYGRVAKTGKPEHFEIEFEPLAAWLSISVYSTKTGYFTAVFDNITKRKQAEERLRENHRFTSALMGNLPGMVFRCRNDKDWTMEFLSRGCQQLTGYKIEDLFNNRKITYAQLIHPEDRERVSGEVQVAFRNNMPFVTTYRIITANGELKWVWTRGRHLFSRGNEIIEGYAFDITETKLAEQELSEAKQQAELYLDLMGHDINNMHQIAMGYLELIEDMIPMDDPRREYVEKPLEVLQRSAQLIMNVRKLQRLKEGVFQTYEIDLCTLLVDLQREFGAVPHKAITLNLNGCERCHVRANELLHDVFANLVGNAIKHTGDAADIVIDLDMVNGNGRRSCRVFVEDNGPGIPDDFKGKVFNRMLKGTDKAKGMGLGLYLVKSLVESYGGRVWVVDSVPGDHTKGARFVVMLPIAE